MNRQYTFLLFYFSITSILSQSFRQSEKFSNWNNILLSINPSYSSSNNNGFSSISYNGFSGIRKNIQSNYADINITKNNKKSRHHFGGFIYSDKNGKYIRASRGHITYAISTPISSAFSLSLGTSFGLLHYGISSNPTGITTSASAIDGNLGLTLNIKNKTYLRSSILQLFDNSITPVQNPIFLSRKYSVQVSHMININHKTQITLNSFYITNSTPLNIGFKFLKKLKNINLGLISQNYYSYHTSLGIIIHHKKSNMAYNLSYYTYQANKIAKSKQFEISIKLFIK